MARLLKMPGVSADSDEAVLERWSVVVGETVAAGSTVASVETEKAIVDIEVDDDSVFHALLFEDGATIAVGEPIAVLLSPGEPASAGEQLLAELNGAAGAALATAPSLPPDAAPIPPEVVPSPAPANAEEPLPVAADASPGTRQFASPLARRRALELGVDILSLVGSGPRGRVRRDDVLAAAQRRETTTPPSAETTSPAGRTTPHSRARKLIAARLQESKRNAPHFYLTRHLNVDALLALRTQVNHNTADRVSINDFFVMAAAKALIEVPDMNVMWTEDAVVSADAADIAVAVASDRGLMTPVIRGVERLSLRELSSEIKAAVARANEGRLQQPELQGGAITVTNLGMYGVDEFAAIINPPQVGILAVAAVSQRPVVTESGDLAVASMVTVTLSVDHRPVDGVVAANWLARLAELIESPINLLV